MKVLFVGDAHGNTDFVTGAIRLAAAARITHVIQVGDFGVWPGDDGAAFLRRVDAAVADTGVWFGFVDGNHDDFDQLDAAAADPSRHNPDGTVNVTNHLHWCRRGTVLTISGRRFGFLGGSVTIDKFQRTPSLSWWPQETPTVADVNALVTNAGHTPLDVLVTHDAPWSVPLNWDTAYRDTEWPEALIDEARSARFLLDGAVAATRPTILIHGHWHLAHHTAAQLGSHTYRAHGLDKEDLDGLAVLDLDDLSFELFVR